MNSQSEENYIKAIAALANENLEVHLSDLSQYMQVSNPSANSMVKKLQQKNWLIYESYKPMVLSPEGQKQAAKIIRKHRLTEMYLVEKMGFGWEEVHAIAEQIEHIDSPKFFDKMDEILGWPSQDPHGSPIPDKDGNISIFPSLGLHNLQAQQQARVMAIADTSIDFLTYLNGLSIKLGTEIGILQKDDFNELMVLQIHQKQHTLSYKVCSKLLIEKI
jgi:DtxR family transcriptional regulator, Mn-dependent transcriptional regulator